MWVLGNLKTDLISFLSHSLKILSNSLWHHVLVAHQAPLSIGFPRKEYWSGLLLPSPRDLPDPGIEPGSPALQGATREVFKTSELLGKSWKPWLWSELLGKSWKPWLWSELLGKSWKPWLQPNQEWREFIIKAFKQKDSMNRFQILEWWL